MSRNHVQKLCEFIMEIKNQNLPAHELEDKINEQVIITLQEIKEDNHNKCIAKHSNLFRVTKDWHDWFAWHPVMLENGSWTFFKKVKREEMFHSNYPVTWGGHYSYKYRKEGK